MGIPGWGWALGTLLEGPRAVNGLFDLYKGIRDDNRIQQNNAGAVEALSDYGSATGPEDIRFIQQTTPSYGINNPDTLLGLLHEGDNYLKSYEVKRQQDQEDQTLGTFGAKAKAAGQDIFSYALANPDQIPWRYLQSAHNVFGTLQTGQEKNADRQLKEQDRTNLANIAAGAPALMQPVPSALQQRAYLPQNQEGPTLGNPQDFTRFGDMAYPKAGNVNMLLGRLIQDNPVTAGSADKIIDDTRQQMQGAYAPTPTLMKVPGENGKGTDTVAYLKNLYNMAPLKLDVNRGPKTIINNGSGNGTAKTGDLVAAYKAELGGVMNQVKQWLNPSEQQMDPQDLLAAIKTGKAGQSIPEEARRGLLQQTQDISDVYVPVIRKSVGVKGKPIVAAVPAVPTAAPGARPPISNFFRTR